MVDFLVVGAEAFGVDEKGGKFLLAEAVRNHQRIRPQPNPLRARLDRRPHFEPAVLYQSVQQKRLSRPVFPHQTYHPDFRVFAQNFLRFGRNHEFRQRKIVRYERHREIVINVRHELI